MSVSTCRHCGERIVRFSCGRREWMHQVEGAAFQDAAHWHCHRAVAEPIEGEA